jgi:DNA repair protein RecO (recombination protein O)
VQRVLDQPAFVLHERPYRETSALIEVLTRDHGRVGLVARGVRSARPRIARALLAPLSPVRLSWMGRGELGNVTAAEPDGNPLLLGGEALMCALYVNELLCKLLPRQDAHPELFLRYAQCLRALRAGENLAWVLRCFERDCLAELGYGLLLDRDAVRGWPIEPDAQYGYEAESGPVAWTPAQGTLRVRGASLLALAQDQAPDAGALAELRQLMRSVLRHHLGGRDLQAWRMALPARARNLD